MFNKRDVTAFTLVKDGLLSTVVYAAKPIPSDYKWGKYRKVVYEGTAYHFFMKGGELSDHAVADIIETIVSGRGRTLDDILNQ